MTLFFFFMWQNHGPPILYIHKQFISSVGHLVCYLSLTSLQGLPPLVRTSGETPGRRLTLPPLKGGAVAHQARKAFGSANELGPSGVPSIPGAMLPHRLPSLRSPTSLQPPLMLGPIGDRGKGPSSGKPVPKKNSPYTSSEEDVTTDTEGVAASATARPPLSPVSNFPPAPPFRTTRPLPAIGGPSPLRGTQLPPVRRQLPLPLSVNVPTSPSTVAGSMPSRRTPVDPFAPLSPTQSTAAPLSPIRSLPSKTPLGRAPPTPLQPPTTIAPIRPPVKPASRLAPSTSGVAPPPPQKTAQTTGQARPPDTLGPGASGASGGGDQPTTKPPQNDQKTTQET